MMRLSTLLTLLWGVSPSLASSVGSTDDSSAGDGLTVTTSTGTVTGIINGTTPDVRQWLGIPYAKPPTGDLRWAAPEPLPESNRTIRAGFLPDACVQAPVYSDGIYGSETGFAYQISTPVSEDCLTLSVWAPAAAAPDRSLLPVLVYIHGGAFTGGGESVPYQLPAQWVQRTGAHVVVSIQYRLGVFGFPNAHALPADQARNLGFLDQRLAVEWVRDNAAAFGGDPRRITLWGQSAGAASVDVYNFAYPDDPIARGFIMDSGSVWLAADGSPNVTEASFARLASRFNCSGSDAAQLACMREQPAAAIQDQIDADNGTSLSFPPTVDNATVFADYGELYEQGHFADVPAVYGTNLDEEPATFMCPARRALEQRAATGRPAFFYQYQGNFSNISPDPAVGAYHSSELPLLFGTYGDVHGAGTEFEAATSRTMQDLWLAFARDPYEGLPEKGWRPFADGYGQILGDTNREIASRSVPIDDVPNWSSCATEN